MVRTCDIQSVYSSDIVNKSCKLLFLFYHHFFYEYVYCVCMFRNVHLIVSSIGTAIVFDNAIYFK